MSTATETAANYRLETHGAHNVHGLTFETTEDAAEALAKLEAWGGYVLSDAFSVGHDEHNVERYAVCVYETQEDCDDDDGAYAPRIIDIN